MAGDNNILVEILMTDNGAIKIVDQMTGSLSGLEKQAPKTSKGVDTMSDAAKRVRTAYFEAGATLFVFNQAIAAINPLFAKFGAAIEKVISVGSGFEDLMGNITTLLGSTGGQVEKFRGSMLKLLATMPVSADDLGAAAYQVVSAGISEVSEALEVLEASARLSVAGLSSMESAVDAVTSVLNAYSFAALQADFVSNTLFNTVKFGKTTMQAISASIGQILPVAKAAGVAFTELQAQAAAMTTGGINIAETYTNMRQIMLSLLKPTAQMEAEIVKMGFSTAEMAIQTLGLQGVLLKLREASDGNIATFAEYFGRVQATTGALLLTGAAAKSVTRNMSAMEKETAALNIAFADQSERLSAIKQINLNKEVLLLTSAYETWEPILKSANEAVSKHLDLFIALEEQFPAVTAGVHLAGGAIATAGSATGSLLNAFSQIAVVGLFAQGIKKSGLSLKDMTGALKGSLAEMPRMASAVSALSKGFKGLLFVGLPIIVFLGTLEGMLQLQGSSLSLLIDKWKQWRGIVEPTSGILQEQTALQREYTQELIKATFEGDKYAKALASIKLEISKGSVPDIKNLTTGFSIEEAEKLLKDVAGLSRGLETAADLSKAVEEAAFEAGLTLLNTDKLGERAEEIIDGLSAKIDDVKDRGSLGLFGEVSFGPADAAELERLRAIKERIVGLSDEEREAVIGSSEARGEAVSQLGIFINTLEVLTANEKVSLESNAKLAKEANKHNKERVALAGQFVERQGIVVSELEKELSLIEATNGSIGEQVAKHIEIRDATIEQLNLTREHLRLERNLVTTANTAVEKENLSLAARNSSVEALQGMAKAMRAGAFEQADLVLLSEKGARTFEKNNDEMANILENIIKSRLEAKGLQMEMEGVGLSIEAANAELLNTRRGLEGATIDVAGAMQTAFQESFDSFLDGSLKAEDAIKNLGEVIKGEFTRAFAETITKKLKFDKIFVNNFEGLGKFVSNLFGGIGSSISSLFGSIGSGISRLFGGIGNSAGALSSDFITVGSSADTLTSSWGGLSKSTGALSQALGGKAGASGGLGIDLTSLVGGLGALSGAGAIPAGTAIVAAQIPIGGYATVVGGQLVSAGAAGLAGAGGASAAAGGAGAATGTVATGLSATGIGAIVAAAVIIGEKYIFPKLDAGFAGGGKRAQETLKYGRLIGATGITGTLLIAALRARKDPSENDQLRKSIKQLIERFTGFAPEKQQANFRDVKGFGELDLEAKSTLKVLSVIVAGMDIFGAKATRVGRTFDFMAAQLVETFTQFGADVEKIARDITGGLGLSLATAVDFFIKGLEGISSSPTTAGKLASFTEGLTGDGTSVQQLIEAQKAGILPTLEEGLALIIELFAVDLPKALEGIPEQIARDVVIRGLKSLHRFSLAPGEDPTDLVDVLRGFVDERSLGGDRKSQRVYSVFLNLLDAFEAGEIQFKKRAGGGIATDTADLLRVLRDVANFDKGAGPAAFQASDIKNLDDIIGGDVFLTGKRLKKFAEGILDRAFESLSKRDLPSGVDDAFGARLDDLILQFAEGTIDSVEEVIDILNREFHLDLNVDDLDINGADIVRRLQLEQEAFNGMVRGFQKAAEVILAGGETKEAIEAFTAEIGNQLRERAIEGINAAFLQVTDFDNVLSPIFTNLEIGIQEIINAFNEGDISSAEAGGAIDDLIAMLGTDFEAVAARAEALGPIIEKFAEVQERIAFALQTFAQTIEIARDSVDNIELLIADLNDDRTFALEKVAEKAEEAKERALKDVTDVIALDEENPLGALGGPLGDLSDEDLKRLVQDLDQAAAAIYAAAQAQIAVLEEELRFFQSWAALQDSSQGALDAVRGFGGDPQDNARREFDSGREKLNRLLKDFRFGDDDQRLAAAQGLTQLGPQLLAAAQAAGFDPGSKQFQDIARVLEATLAEINAEATVAEDKARAIQEEIRDLQADAVLELQSIVRLQNAARIEAADRAQKVKKKTDDSDLLLDPLPSILENIEGVFKRLNIGINVVSVKAKRIDPDAHKILPGIPLREPDPEVPEVRHGGIVVPRTGAVPALLHGPEAVIPLDRLGEFANEFGGGGKASSELVNVLRQQNEQGFATLIERLVDKSERHGRDQSYIRGTDGTAGPGGRERELNIVQNISANLTKMSDDEDEAEFQKMMLKLMPKLLKRPAMRRALKDAVKGL